MIGKICGTGSYIPPKILSNDDLSEMVETSDEWIRERTGVRNRHIAGEETSSFMASEAAKRAVENAGISPEEIDLILVASSSPDVIFPSVACEVQKAIGAVHASGYDMQAACTGFVFAYQTAQAYIEAGFYKTILLIGSEALSTMVDWTDRGTCIPGEIPKYREGSWRYLYQYGRAGRISVCGEKRAAGCDGSPGKGITYNG